MPLKHELVELPNDTWGIKILESEYYGIIYRYGEVKFLGEEENGFGVLKFEFEVLEDQGFTPEELSSKELETIMGDILQNLIQESLEKTDNNANN